MEENKILRENKIPGCDEMTKPEEIKALSKYLKKIKEVQSEHTTLQKDNLEVPGRKTGRIPKISKLPDTIETVDGKTRKVDLSKQKLNIPNQKNSQGNLNNYKERLTKNGEVTNLPNLKKNLKDDRKSELSNYKESINDDREQQLSNYKESLINNGQNNKLSDYKESLNDDRKRNSLNGYIEELDAPNKIKSLSNNKEVLDINSDSKLTNHKEKLEDNRNLEELPNYKETIDNSGSESLSNYKETLEVNKNSELNNYRENLEIDKEDPSVVKSLPDYKENITDNKDSSLSNYKESIIGQSKEDLQNLSDYQEKLKLEGKEHNGKITEFSDYQEGLDLYSGDHSGSVDNLSDTLAKLEPTDDKENSLSNYKEELNLESGGNSGQIDELNDYQENIIDSRETELSDFKEQLEGADSEVELGDYQEKLNDDRDDINLSDFKETIEDSRENKLSDYLEELIGGENEAELSDYKEPLNLNATDGNSDAVSSLPDIKINLDLADDKEEELSDYQEKLNLDSGENSGSIEELGDYKEGLTDDRENELGNFIDELVDNRENAFKDTKIQRPNVISPTTQDPTRPYNYFDPSAESNELYDSVLEKPSEKAPETQDPNRPYDYFDPSAEGNELYDSVLERPNQTEGTKASIFEDVINKSESDNGTDINSLIEKVKASTNEKDFYNNLLKLFDNFGEWGKKIEGIMSSYLSGTVKLDQLKVAEYEAKLAQEFDYLKNMAPIAMSVTPIDIEPRVQSEDSTLYIPSYKLPKFNLLGNGLNANTYLRWAVENTVGNIPLHGTAKELLLNETLALLITARDELEKVSDANRDRLPGGELSQALSDLVGGGVTEAVGGMVKRAIGAAVGTNINTENPMNRPDGNPVTAWEEVNNRTTSVTTTTNDTSGQATKTKLWENVGETLSDIGSAALGLNNSNRTYSFAANYLTGKGIKLTLSELCGTTLSNASSVDDLFSALRASPYITVPDKFTTTGNNGYVSRTLDSNAYWEIILEPYCGPDNGGYSYLPAIQEINTRNTAIHGVNTAYSHWIPFIGFDLQKSRMHSKNISLYDGEISYPISMEYINELRLTIVDDQYKSWRTYFETCADAAIYNSEVHEKDYYTTDYSGGVTAIDKSSVCVALYKNVAFRCVIFVMTPQLSTIKKYDLLLTLKDMTEESVGDPSPETAGDLTVSFSIVGENPKTEIKVTPDMPPKIEKVQNGNDYTSIIDSGVDDIIGIFD